MGCIIKQIKILLKIKNMQKNYNDTLNFEESDSFELPDFSITFLGETKVEKEKYVNEFFI